MKMYLCHICAIGVFALIFYVLQGINTKFYVIVGALLLLSACELFWPAFIQKCKNTFARLISNYLLSILAGVIAGIPPILVAVYLQNNNYGTFNQVDFPIFTSIAGFILLDLSFYIAHRAAHEIKWMWRFHQVHHCDRYYDVSVFGRIHPGTAVILGSSRIITVLIFGISPMVTAVYILAINLGLLFCHTNIALPAWVDKTVGFIFVTPKIHYFHHSDKQHQTDSNYGVLFSFWDRWFGSYTDPFKVSSSSVVVGLSQHPDQDKLLFWGLIKMPFVSQKKGVASAKL